MDMLVRFRAGSDATPGAEPGLGALGAGLAVCLVGAPLEGGAPLAAPPLSDDDGGGSGGGSGGGGASGDLVISGGRFGDGDDEDGGLPLEITVVDAADVGLDVDPAAAAEAEPSVVGFETVDDFSALDLESLGDSMLSDL